MTQDAKLFPVGNVKKKRRIRSPSMKRELDFTGEDDLLRWIEAKARANKRTLSQEILYRLDRAKIGQEKALAGRTVYMEKP